jgi:hypothetical protein
VWSRDNRTAGFRLCGEGGKGIRIECRIGGADLNPYLAFSGLIAAGLAGIEEKLALEPPFSGDAYIGGALPEVPKTLREATERMAGSEFLRGALGSEVVDHYVHTARWEQFEYDRRITDWELMRGFERYCGERAWARSYAFLRSTGARWRAVRRLNRLSSRRRYRRPVGHSANGCACHLRSVALQCCASWRRCGRKMRT